MLACVQLCRSGHLAGSSRRGQPGSAAPSRVAVVPEGPVRQRFRIYPALAMSPTQMSGARCSTSRISSRRGSESRSKRWDQATVSTSAIVDLVRVLCARQLACSASSESNPHGTNQVRVARGGLFRHGRAPWHLTMPTTGRLGRDRSKNVVPQKLTMLHADVSTRGRAGRDTKRPPSRQGGGTAQSHERKRNVDSSDAICTGFIMDKREYP